MFRRPAASQTGVDSLGDPPRDHLEQYNQPCVFVSFIISQGYQVNDSKPTGTDPYDGGNNASRPSLSRRISGRVDSGVDTGYSARNTSRQSYTSPDLLLF